MNDVIDNMNFKINDLNKFFNKYHSLTTHSQKKNY